MADDSPFAAPEPAADAGDGLAARRAGAAFVDAAILLASFVPVAAVLAFRDGQLWLHPGLVMVGFGLSVAYGTAFEASPWHATPGKRLLGLEVRDGLGRRPDMRSALARNLVKTFLVGLCGLPAITALRGPGLWNRQSGHRIVRRA